MTRKLIRIGRMAALGVVLAIGVGGASGAALADKVRVQINVQDSLSVRVADRGHGNRGYEHNGHSDHGRYSRDGYGNRSHRGHDDHYRGHRRHHRAYHIPHGFSLNGWRPARHAQAVRYRHGYCFPVTKRGYWHGRRALLGARACEGHHGHTYIVRRSVHLEHYLHRYGHYHGAKYCNVRH